MLSMTAVANTILTARRPALVAGGWPCIRNSSIFSEEEGAAAGAEDGAEEVAAATWGEAWGLGAGLEQAARERTAVKRSRVRRLMVRPGDGLTLVLILLVLDVHEVREGDAGT